MFQQYISLWELLMSKMKQVIGAIKLYLSKFSFRTGVIILALCISCYIISFAQMLLPISTTAKSALWVLFFGLAKTLQYTGLAIVGMEGWLKIKMWFNNRKQHTNR